MCRESLDNYAKGEYEARGEIATYVDVLKAARTVIEAEREELLIRRESGNISGIIFALKQHGWRDDKHITVQQTERQRLVLQLPQDLADLLAKQAGEPIGTTLDNESAKPV